MVLTYLISVGFTTIAILLIKQYTLDKNMMWLFLTLISYIIVIWAYVIILEFKSMAPSYSILKIINILLLTFFGIFFYNETMNKSEIIGIITAIISLVLLSK